MAPSPCKTVGCPVFGSDATNGYCSMCHKARVQTTAATTSTTPEVTNSSDQTVAGETIAPTVTVDVLQRNVAEPTENRRGEEEESTSAREQPEGSTFDEEQEAFDPATIVEMAEGRRASQKGVDGSLRCYSCTKRLSVGTWPCKCGQVFCSSHVHYMAHSCTFDYKASGRAAIAKANPIVTGSKLKKI